MGQVQFKGTVWICSQWMVSLIKFAFNNLVYMMASEANLMIQQLSIIFNGQVHISLRSLLKC